MPIAGADYWFLGPVSGTASDVWAIGNADDGGHHQWGIAEHWTGAAWSYVSIPQAAGLTFVGDVSSTSSNDAWIVGYGTATNSGPGHLRIWHWDGSSWSAMAAPGLCSSDSILYTVDALSSTDVWAAGGCGSGQLVIHYDGVSWSRVSAPNPPSSGTWVVDLSATSTGDVWAVGTYHHPLEQPLIEHWNGSSWKLVDGPALSGDASLFALAQVSRGDVWAVGRHNGNSLSEHWDGANWQVVTTVDPFWRQALDSIAALPDGRLWAVGQASEPLLEQLVEAPVDDTGAVDPVLTSPMGLPLAWHFQSANTIRHSVTDATGMSLFDSGLRGHDRSYLRRFSAAGTYRVVDAGTGRLQQIQVPMKAQSQLGRIRITWSIAAPPRGFVFDVQIRRPGASSFARLKHGTTSTTSTLLARHGTYSFRARLRRLSANRACGWSPSASVTIS